MIWPALPRKSDEMRAQLGLAPLAPAGKDLWPARGMTHEGAALGTASALFPTFDDPTAKALVDKLTPKSPDATSTPTSNATTTSTSTSSTTASATSIDYEQFSSVDLRVGVVKSCERVPKKDKLLMLSVDLGEPELRTLIAGLALSFTPESLVGRRIVVVANLAPRDFGKGLVSHGMLLAAGPSDKLVLATVDGDAPPGARLK
jgi:methionyl-tRNA synthetase